MSRRGKPPTPDPVKQLAAKVKTALGAKNLTQPVRDDRLIVDSVVQWELSARSVPVRLDATFPGHWRLNMSWTFVPIPPRGELQILQSSIGLYAARVPVLGGGDEEVCLVRYDTDRRKPGSTLEPLGAHLNVFQPGRLEDKVHYQLPGLTNHFWDLSEVLEFFLSARLANDLADRLHR